MTPIAKDSLVRNLTSLSHVRSISNWHQCEGCCTSNNAQPVYERWPVIDWKLCANFYAKPSFELLKTWNRVKHRYGEHRRTTAEVPRQKNWWNAQIADVSRKTRNLCVIHAFTRILDSVTGPFQYGGVTWASWRLKSPTTLQSVQVDIKESIKTRIVGLLSVSPGDQWISLTKGQ